MSETNSRTMQVRRFNDSGMDAFRSLLAKLRENPSYPVTWGLMDNPLYTDIVEPTITIEQRSLETKADAANYLAEILQPLSHKSLRYDSGLWTWLTLFFMDSIICPLTNGARSVKNNYHYVFDAKNSQYYYRHHLFISWEIHRTAKPYTRFSSVPS